MRGELCVFSDGQREWPLVKLWKNSDRAADLTMCLWSDGAISIVRDDDSCVRNAEVAGRRKSRDSDH